MALAFQLSSLRKRVDNVLNSDIKSFNKWSVEGQLPFQEIVYAHVIKLVILSPPKAELSGLRLGVTQSERW